MKNLGEKIAISIMFGFFTLFVAFLIGTEYKASHATGTEIKLGIVSEPKTVQVEARGSYKVVIESCNPFAVTIDHEENLSGVPQNTEGTYCYGSYYKIEETLTAKEIAITSGGPSITLTAEVPLGTTVGYTEEETASVKHEINVIAGLIWVVLVLIILFLL